MSNLRECANAGCVNLCRRPDIYCGACASYSNEMTSAERQKMIHGCLLTVAIGATVPRKFDRKKKKK